MGGKLNWLKTRALSGMTTPPTNMTNKPISPTQTFGSIDQDPLLTLDITTSLFPLGSADPLDPTAFHDLLTHATALIQTFQSAYRVQASALYDLQAEHAAQADELDEAETRARHLKMQLDDMGGRLVEQERECEVHLLRERTQKEEAERRWEEVEKKKISGGSGDHGSDSGFESEGDGDARSQSSAGSSPELVPCEPENSLAWGAQSKMQSSQRESWKGTGALNAVSIPNGLDLRTENQALRLRIADLELAVDSCLDLLG
jgi:hypothetical protein